MVPVVRILYQAPEGARTTFLQLGSLHERSTPKHGIFMKAFSSQSFWATFLRFAFNGGGAALVAIATYYLCAAILSFEPLWANFVAYITQFAFGYQMHRAYSFRRSSPNFSSMARYLVMSIAAFALNSVWVWLLTALLGLPIWTPIVPMVAATPIMTFFVARHWVFRVA